MDISVNILVICSGSMGHYHGIKNFIDYLKLGSDYKVMYSFHGFPKDMGKNDPSRYHLNSFPAFLNYEFRFTKKIKDVIQLKQYNVLLNKRMETLRELFEYFKPDVILLDNHAFTDGFVLKKEFGNMGFKALFFQTRLSTELGKDSVYGTHISDRLDWLSSRKILWRQKLHRLKYRLMMPGYSKYRQLEKYTKGLHLELNNFRYRLPSISHIPELLISGSNLSQYQTPNQHYMGLCISPKWSTEKKPEPIQILVSAGSVVNKLKYLPSYKEVIQKLIQLLPHFHFAVPAGLKVDKPYSNVSFYSWEEYHDALSQSHIHITHGGINSIKDSLTYGVPSLICPLDWESDQIHNALFFEKLNLSQTWNIKKDSVEEIAAKLEKLAEDEYPKRVKSFVINENSKYPPERIREEFIELIQEQKWKVRNW